MKAGESGQTWRSRFYRNLSPKSQLKLYLAVFFIFAPMQILFVSSIGEHWDWYNVLIWMAASGMVAVGWAYSFTRNRKLLFLIIPAQFVIPMALHALFPPPLMTPSKLTLTVFLFVASIVLGYTLFFFFINVEGARSLRLQTEMSLAQEIHSHLVPPLSLTTGQLELFGKSAASSEVGGDLLDVFEKSGMVILTVADVSGHGVQAGLLMAMVKSATRLKFQHPSEAETFIDDLNRVVFDLKKPDMFVTFAGIWFDGTKVLRYALAGHPPILHYQMKSNTISRLAAQRPPLGIMKDLSFVADSRAFLAGDLFVVLTDGLTEVENKNGEEFGIDRIEKIVIEQAKGPLSELYGALIGAVRAHGEQTDDQTLLLARSR